MESSINKCMCCGYELGSAPHCKICGRSPVSVTGGIVNSAMIEQMSKRYIHDKLQGIDVLVKIYTYDCTKEGAAKVAEEYVRTFSVENYWVGDTIFSELAFEPIASEREFTVDVRVSGNGADRDYSLLMRPGCSLSHSRIGLRFEECMKARLVVGDEENFCCSDEFELYIRN